MSNITERIAKLLALADGAGTPHEAATALSAAQTLMTRHSISQEQIAAAEAQRNGARVDEPIVSRIVYVYNKGHAVLWIEWLAVTIVQCNQGAVRNAWAEDNSQRKALRMFGTARDLDMMATLMQGIVGQIEALRDRWSKATGNTGRTERDQYCRGAATTVIARLKAAVKEARAAALSEAERPVATFALPAAGGDAQAQEPAPNASTALVVVAAIAQLDKRARDAVAAMNVSLGRPATRKAYASSRDTVKDSGAREAGRRDGHRVNITRSAALKA